MHHPPPDRDGFPVPEAADDARRVYLSVGHQQMMTEAMKPLGLSVWQLTALRPMVHAGGRLFVDVTDTLASPTGRAQLLDVIGRSDPLMLDALQTVLGGDDVAGPHAGGSLEPIAGSVPAVIETDPAIVGELVARTEASLAALQESIATVSGPALFDFIVDDVAELQRLLWQPPGAQAVLAGIQATWWLNEHLREWLGEENAADALTLSAPDNVTSEMGLALLDVADAIRPHPEVVAFLAHAGDGFLDELADLPGGRAARDAIAGFLDRYGARCVGEIDITRPRWREQPAALVPLLLSHVRSAQPGEARRRFEAGRQHAEAEEREVLDRLRALPGGEAKAAEAKAMIDRVRTFIGYREFPKFGLVRRYAIYKEALLAEADRLVERGALRAVDDCFYLTFDELRDAVATGRVDAELVERRRREFASFEALAPPRVLVSDGVGVSGRYRRDDVPAGALAGLAVSAGTVEGRARVVLDLADADVEPGDILVTAYTDPSWSPLFVAVAGLVTEVGGLMTHGAVVAREYGLPAVVGVERATERIADGQRIRVDGTRGVVELLGDPP